MSDDDMDYTVCNTRSQALNFVTINWCDHVKVQTSANYTINPFAEQASNPGLTTWFSIRSLTDMKETIDSVYDALNTYNGYEFCKTTFEVIWRFGMVESHNTTRMYCSFKVRDTNEKAKIIPGINDQESEEE